VRLYDPAEEDGMRELIRRYVGKVVGANLERTHHIDSAEVVEAHEAYFTLRSSTDGHLHHVMYTNVVQAIEDPAGVEIRHLFTANERFELVIKMGHVIAYVQS